MHRILVTVIICALAAGAAQAHRCTGDCDGSDTVSVGELVTGVRIALERAPLFTCLSFDADIDRRVSIDELLVAVNNAFSFCGHGSPTATATATATETAPPPSATATEMPRADRPKWEGERRTLRPLDTPALRAGTRGRSVRGVRLGK